MKQSKTASLLLVALFLSPILPATQAQTTNANSEKLSDLKACICEADEAKSTIMAVPWKEREWDFAGATPLLYEDGTTIVSNLEKPTVTIANLRSGAIFEFEDASGHTDYSRFPNGLTFSYTRDQPRFPNGFTASTSAEPGFTYSTFEATRLSDLAGHRAIIQRRDQQGTSVATEIRMFVGFGGETFSFSVSETTPTLCPCNWAEMVHAMKKACPAGDVKFAAHTDKKSHPTPAPLADKALVYIVRVSAVGPIQNRKQTKLAIDRQWIGVNRGNNYYYVNLEPGEHYFCSVGANRSELALNVEAGRTYYLEQEIQWDPGRVTFNFPHVLHALSEAEGREALAKCHFSTWEERK